MRKLFRFIFSFQYSKFIILFETIMVGYLVYNVVDIARLCVLNGYCGTIPWLTTMITSAFAAYGTSVGFYYNKSKAEQLKKIETTGTEYSKEITEETSTSVEYDEWSSSVSSI